MLNFDSHMNSRIVSVEKIYASNFINNRSGTTCQNLFAEFFATLNNLNCTQRKFRIAIFHPTQIDFREYVFNIIRFT